MNIQTSEIEAKVTMQDVLKSMANCLVDSVADEILTGDYSQYEKKPPKSIKPPKEVFYRKVSKLLSITSTKSRY